MRFRDLGPLQVEIEELALPVGGRRLVSVLALLVARVGEVVGTAALIDAVWSDQPPVRAGASLESLVWRLRKTLEPVRPAGLIGSMLRTEGAGYRLAVSADSVDSRQFTAAATQVATELNAGDPGRALETAQTALSLWRGDPYLGVPDAQWLVPAREQLWGARAALSDAQVRALLETGQPERAMAVLAPLLAADRFRERWWEHRMLALYRTGRQGAALETFEQARAVLNAELGVDPGKGLRELHRRILAQDPDLELERDRFHVATSAVDVHLPSRRSTLIGRDTDLAALDRLLASPGVVCLVGPGGAGKTRLAIEAAHLARERFSGGVWFVDLTAVDRNGDVALQVADTLRLRLDSAVVPLDGVLAHVSGRSVLLVLDNCEHVLVGAAELAERICEKACGATVLATSREPLDIADESVWPVLPLALPGPDPTEVGASPAVQLFVQRLANRRPDLDLLGSEGAAVARICVAVGGLPLGIELAAAHARSFEIEEIAATLERNPAHLSRLGVGPDRQATLLDTVEWSCRLARPDERVLHRRLSLVAGPITLEAAAALCSVPPLTSDRAMELISGLVQRSLLVSTRPGAPGRPTTFHQLVPIRAHAAAAWAGADERAAVVAAHDTWLIERILAVPRDGSPGQSEFYAWLDDNVGSVRAVLTSALVSHPGRRGLDVDVALVRYWFDRNRLIEGAQWTRALLEQSEAAGFDPVDTATAAAVHGSVLALGRDPAAAQALFDDHLPVLIANADDRARRSSHVLFFVSLGCYLGRIGDVGLRAADAAVAIATELDEVDLALCGRAVRALNQIGAGLREPALAEADDILAITAARSNGFAELNAAVTRSAAARMDGDGEAGIAWTRRAVMANRSVGGLNMADLGELLAAHLLNAGQQVEALRCFAACFAVHSRSGLTWPRRVATAASLDALLAAIPAGVYEQVWASGERIGRADPEGFINAWL